MKFVYSIFLIFLLACQQERTYPEYEPEPEVNHWEYINRISDTLQEIEEFSLFNSPEKNRVLFLNEKENMKYIKYRIGQNKYLPVQVFAFHPLEGIICYRFDQTFEISVNTSGQFLALDHVGNLKNYSLKNQFNQFLIHLLNYSINGYSNGTFSFNKRSEFSQELLLQILNQLLDGYMEYLDVLSQKIYKNKFINLNLKNQNILLKSTPFRLNYNFDLLIPKMPPVM